MGFKEEGEVLKLLDVATKTLDKVGELSRDVRLVRRRNPHMPEEIKSLLQQMEATLSSVLRQHDTWEKSVTDVLARMGD